MREIKFRVWNKNTSTMVDSYKITPLALSVDQDGIFLPFSDQYVLMQYTGLKDRNGKDIYEGDIVRRGAEMPKNLPRGLQNIYTIVFEEGCFVCAEMNGLGIGEGWGVKFVASSYQSELEVIGNIYKNPELLERSNSENPRMR